MVLVLVQIRATVMVVGKGPWIVTPLNVIAWVTVPLMALVLVQIRVHVMVDGMAHWTAIFLNAFH